MEYSMSSPEENCAGAVPGLPGAEVARLTSELTDCRRRCELLAERERRIASLLHSTAPERIEHDLRNVMNELQLLRTLFERQEK